MNPPAPLSSVLAILSLRPIPFHLLPLHNASLSPLQFVRRFLRVPVLHSAALSPLRKQSSHGRVEHRGWHHQGVPACQLEPLFVSEDRVVSIPSLRELSVSTTQ